MAAAKVTTTLHIKNMVCDRCIRVVREELERLGITVAAVQLGRAEVTAPEDGLDLAAVGRTLATNGFELLQNHQAQLVERIKTTILDLIHSGGLEELPFNYSHYIARRVGRSYNYLSTLFSQVENLTIEKFIILQKIEKTKELLIYDEFTLSEIAYRLGYSSSQHLSGQFKAVTGLTPTAFRRGKGKRRPLDQLTQ